MKKLSTMCMSTVLPLFLLSTVISCKHSTEIPVIPKQIQLQKSPTLGTYLADKDGRHFICLQAMQMVNPPVPELVKQYGRHLMLTTLQIMI